MVEYRYFCRVWYSYFYWKRYRTISDLRSTTHHKLGTSSVWNNHDVTKVCNFRRWKELVRKSGKNGQSDKELQTINHFYLDMVAETAKACPNTFHHWASNLAKTHRVVVLTMNIDSLFEQAGCTNVTHLHGNIALYKCIICGQKQTAYSPRCPILLCGSRFFKTDVTFYGEDADVPYTYALNQIAKLQRGDTMIVAGTSARTFEQSRKAWDDARDRGVRSIHINPHAAPMVDYPADLMYLSGTTKFLFAFCYIGSNVRINRYWCFCGGL
jgi:NAD-dependent SIR2 family protein deacetylase